MADGSNERFTEAVTTQAFALTLSRAMIEGLAEAAASAAAGSVYQSNERGVHGLERRGLVCWSSVPTLSGKPAYGWRPTRAGLLVLELCRCAGLQPGDPGDDFLAAIRARVRQQAQQEQETAAEQDRRHREWVDRLAVRKSPETSNAGVAP